MTFSTRTPRGVTETASSRRGEHATPRIWLPTSWSASSPSTPSPPGWTAPPRRSPERDRQPVVDPVVAEFLVDLVRRRVGEVGEQHRDGALGEDVAGGRGSDRAAIAVPAVLARRVYRSDAG